MTRPVIIIDTKTTGLDSERHDVWEIGLIDRGPGTGHLYRVRPDLARADPQALAVGRYYERTAGMQPDPYLGFTDLTEFEDDDTAIWSAPAALARHLAPLLDGAILVAANPAFDAGFLAAFLRRNGEAPAWNYRLRDIGSIAYGYLRSSDNPGYSAPVIGAGTDDLALALGVNPEDFERHSALGDCLLVAAMLDVIEGGAR